MGSILASTAALFFSSVVLSPAAEASDVDQPEEQDLPSIRLQAEPAELYLQGRHILIPMAVKNHGQTQASYPDLSARPHLVHFQLTHPSGKRQVRHTTAPLADDGSLWRIPPGRTREVLLEIPSGGALPAGDYGLEVSIVAEGYEARLPQKMRIVAPNPAGAHVPTEMANSLSAGLMLPWVHTDPSGSHLFLDVVPTETAGVVESWYLSSIPGAVVPQLAASRPAKAWNRHIYWVSSGSLWYTRLRGRELRHGPRRIDLPYPTWEPLARGGTDPQGELHVPVWIPSPQGGSGEVRILTVDQRGMPTFRAVTRLERKPVAASTVDAAGQIRLALAHGGNLDLFTMNPERMLPRLPVPGKRLAPRRPPPPSAVEAPDDTGLYSPVAPETDQASQKNTPPSPISAALHLEGLAFDILPASEGGFRGGLALFGWWVTSGAVESLVSGAWYDLDGNELVEVEGAIMPKGESLVQVAPDATGALAVVTRDSSGGVWLRKGLHTASLDGWTSQDSLIVSPEKSPLHIRVRAGAGISGEPAPLTPPPDEP